MSADAERDKPLDAADDTPQSSHLLVLAKQTIIYGLGGVALQAVGILTLPVFARVLTKSQYGKLELATVLSALALALVDAGFGSAAQRSFYDYSGEQAEQRRRVLFTALSVTSALGFIAAVTLALARHEVSSWLFNGPASGALVVFVAISIPLVNMANFLRETMRLRFRAWHYVASSFLGSVVAGGLAVVGVVVFDLDVRGVFVGIIAGNVLATAYGFLVSRRDISGKFDRTELRRMLGYGLPLVPAAGAAWGLALADRIILSHLGNLADVGQYAVANRLANVLLLAVTGFALAFGPYIFALYSEDPELERIIRGQALRFLTIGLSLAGLVLSLFAREIIDLVAPAFDRAYEAVGLLVFAVVAFGVSSVVMAGISYARRTELAAGITLAAATVNIGLNFALIPPFGIVGAAVANAVSYAVLAGLYYVVSQRLYPTAYEPQKLMFVIGLATAMGFLGVIPIGPLGLAIVVKLLAVAAFLIVLRTSRVILPEEISRLRDLASGMWRLRAASA